MDATFIQKRKSSCVADEGEGSLGSLSSPSASSSENSIGSSASSDLTDDAASSPPPSSSCPPPTSCRGPLFEMSALKEQLPFKRGLSKFYQGKSQSFASFSDIKSFEDLVKPERPLKKLKTSKSCGEGLDDNRSLLNLKCCSRRIITKKAPKSSLSSSTSARRNCFSLASKPPLHPQRPSNSDQPLWFA